MNTPSTFVPHELASNKNVYGAEYFSIYRVYGLEPLHNLLLVYFLPHRLDEMLKLIDVYQAVSCHIQGPKGLSQLPVLRVPL